MNLLPFPASLDDIPLDYDIYKKGDWHGPISRLYGLGVWLARRIHTIWMAMVVVAVVGATLAGGFLHHWGWFIPPGPLFVLYVLLRVFEIDHAADNAMENFIQQLDDDVYSPDGTISEATRWHEGGHVWQGENNTAHKWRYILDPRGLPVPWLKTMTPYYRCHAEAQAYALEVVKGFDTMKSVSKSMSKPLYALGVNEAEAFDLIKRYATRWNIIDSGTP